MKIAWPQFQSRISRFFASFTHQSKWKTSPLVILYMSMILILITNQIVFAQTTEDLTVDLGIVNGCEWSAGAGSDLTVRDNNTCRIVGITTTADSVYVEHDTDGAGQDGGKLIIGYASGSDPTIFTVDDGDINIGTSTASLPAPEEYGGLLWIGGDTGDTGTGTSNLTLTGNGHDFYGHSGSTTTLKSNGEITATANSNIIHIFDNSNRDNPGQLTTDGTIDAYQIYIGFYDKPTPANSINGGAVTIQSNGQITATRTGWIQFTPAFEIYNGNVTNESGGQINLVGSFEMHGDAPADESTLNNNGTITNTNDFFVWTNSTLTNTNSFIVDQLHIGYYNNSTPANSFDGGTVTNQNGGTINTTRTAWTDYFPSLGIYNGTLTNEYGGTIDIDGSLQMRGTYSADRSIFNNYGDIIGSSYHFIFANSTLNLQDGGVLEPSTYINSSDLAATSQAGTAVLDIGKINISQYSTVSAYRISAGYRWSSYYQGEVNNSGIISRNGDRTTSSTNYMYVDSYGGSTFTNQATGYIDIFTGHVDAGNHTALPSADPTNDTFTNLAGGIVTTNSTSASGSMSITNGGKINNSGDIEIRTISVRNSASYSGALLKNNIGGTMTAHDTVAIGYYGDEYGGRFENEGTLTINEDIVLQNNAEYYSSTTSTLNLNGINTSNAQGFFIKGFSTGSKAGLNGNIIGDNSRIEVENGYLCIGEWAGGTSCTHDSSGSINITNKYYSSGSAISSSAYDNTTPYDNETADIDIENDVTIDGNVIFGAINPSNGATTTVDQGTNSTITITHDTTGVGFGILYITDQNTTTIFNGEVNVKNTIADSDHGYLKVYYGADVTLNGSGDIGSLYMYSGTSAGNDTVVTIGENGTIYLIDYETCYSGLTGICALEVGPYDYDYDTTLNIEGDLVINNSGYRTGEPMSRIGYITNSGAGNEIVNVLAGAAWDGKLENTTTGTFHTQLSGEINAQYTDATYYGEIEVQGQAHMDGTGDIDGSLDTYDLMRLELNGNMTVGSAGIMDANGSQTTIDGDLQLDGELNRTTARADAGDVVVTSTGTVTSGPGTSTNFIINTNDLTVDSGGSISSDEVSTYGSHSGAGSYGGEGEGRSANSTYGKTKMDIDDTATYGEAGKTGAGIDVNGGGGVRINANGNIDISGTISANGAASTNSSGGSGAGGTVILIHDIDHTDTLATFTGAGTISANGGGSATASVPVGGGGKIVIDSILYDDPDDTGGGEYGFTGTIQALGGTNSTDSDYAAAGAIVLLGDDNNTNGTLIINQGGNASSEDTEINNTGTDADFTFSRVEVLGSGSVIFESAPALSPTGCFRTSGTIEGPISCNAYPDKPDTLYINNTYTGAQTADEPSFPSPVENLIDITPSFSFIARNPTNTAEEYDNVAIQVASDTSFSSLLWDATGASVVTLNNSVHDGERIEDFEYAGSPLSTNTTYYVRTALVDSSGNQGLWTHRDMGEFYQFEITDNLQIDASGCSNSLALTDGSATGRAIGSLVRNTNGDRYGTGNCTLQASSTLTDWQILFGKAIGATAFEDSNQAYNIDEIDNAGADCTIDTTGATQEEEYGYNITTNTSDADNTLINGGVQTNATCSAAYNSSSSFFNIENSGSEDAIVKVTGNAISNDADFVLNMHANLDSSTEHGTTYDLDTRMIITTNP